MKYGIPVNGRVTEPVCIPPSKEADPLAWLAKQFPGYSGWVPVSEDCVPGATYNGPGDSTNPPMPAPPVVPATLSKTAFMDLCETAFGGGTTGRARFGKIIKACAASTDDEVRFVYERYQGALTFDKTKVFGFFTLLINKGVGLVDPAVSTTERTAVNNGWPNV